jgi:hypothetical protein
MTWQELSRITIIGTDKQPLSEDARARFKASGVPFDESTPDVHVVQRALTLAGLLAKRQGKITKTTYQPPVWQPNESEQEAPPAGPWLQSLCSDKSGFIFFVLDVLQARSLLFPAEYLPALIEHNAKAPNLYRLLDSRAQFFVEQIPEYRLYQSRFEQKASKAKLKPEKPPLAKAAFLEQIRTTATFDQSQLAHLVGQLPAAEKTVVYQCFFDRARTQLEVKSFLELVAIHYPQPMIAEIMAMMEAKQMHKFYQEAVQNCLNLVHIRAKVDEWLSLPPAE